MRKVLILICFLLSSCGSFQATQGPLTWDHVRWQGVYQQELDSSCGIASILTIMNFHFGENYSERELIQRFIEISTVEEITLSLKEGLSFIEISSLASSYGYKSTGLHLDFFALRKAVQQLPALVYLELGSYPHFVVVRGISDTEVWYADPSGGNVYVSHANFLKQWAGQRALFIARNVSSLRNQLLRTPSDAPSSLNILRGQVLR